MIAAIYARVSTEMQVDTFSLSAQIAEIASYCEKNKIETYKIYVDEGESGTKENRPKFQEMIRDAEKKLFNIILVHKFDRFARSVELSSKIKTRLRKANVNVISITEPIEDSPIGFFQEGLMALLSEYFVKNLAREVKKGQKGRVQKGDPCGKVPFGYYNENKKVLVDEEKAAIIRMVFQMYVDGDGYGKIADYLKRCRIPTRENHIWRHYHIGRIIKNRFYIGEIEYGGEIYPSSSPAIVDKELFERAQRYRNKRNEPHQYRTSLKSTILFAGILFCGECKRTMSIATNQKIRHYYHCPTGKNMYLNDICTQKKYIICHRLDKKLIDFLTNLAQEKHVKIEMPPIQEPVFISQTRREKIKEELERAKTAYVRAVFSLEEYTEIKQTLENELKFMQKEESKKPQKVNIKSAIKNMLKELKACDQKDIPKMKSCLQKYIEKIYYTPSTLEIVWVRAQVSNFER